MLLSRENVLTKFAVVTMTRQRPRDTAKMFLRPGQDMTAHIKGYQKKGYRVENIALLNKEEYINARIDETTEHLNDLAREECHLRHQFKTGEISLKDYSDAMELTCEVKWAYLRTLYKQMHRFDADDCECHNEMAIQWYNMYF